MKGSLLRGTLLCMLWLPCQAWGQQASDTITRRSLEEVIVKERKLAGRERVSREKMMRVPSLLGEYDLVKYLATLPGVFSVNALDPGIYVRGGSSTENAFWVNGMEVANPSHLTGIISMFDSYVLGQSVFYKSGFPSQYNNYLSAYVNMTPVQGNMECYHGEASLGLLSSSLKLQGPLVRKHTSFALSGRTSYLQHIARWYNKANDSESMPAYGFSDVTLGVTSVLNSRWSLSAFGLYTTDRLRITVGTNDIKHKLGWSTYSANVKIRHAGERDVLSFGGGLAASQTNGESNGYVEMDIDNRYHTWEFFVHYNRELVKGWNAEIGGKLTRSLFDLNVQGNFDFDIYQLYLNTRYEFNPNWEIVAGLNYQYYEGYANVREWSPRLKTVYRLGDWSVWGDYAKTVQYVAIYPYFTLPTPVDMKYPLDKEGQPAECHHVSLGVDKQFANGLYFYVALFYKEMLHLKDFLSGVKMNQEELSRLLVEGNGCSKGMEADVVFERGRFYGRVNYTLSESTRQFDKINGGRRFHSPFDMKHRLLISCSLTLARSWRINSTWTYSSGGYATFPVSVAFAQDITSVKNNSKFVPIFRDRYNFRLPDNHRLDVGIQYDKRRGACTYHWAFGVYNLYNQQNPTFVYFEPQAKDKYYTQFVPHSKVLLPFIPYVSFTLEW